MGADIHSTNFHQTTTSAWLQRTLPDKLMPHTSNGYEQVYEWCLLSMNLNKLLR